MPIVPFEEFGAGSEVEPEAPPGEQAQPNLVSFEDFGKGEGGPTESNDFMGRALSSMKSVGGSTAVLADLILGAPWFAISFGANLGAQAASLMGGEEQPRPADDPLSFRAPSALKVAGQSGRRMQGQLMEDFGNPLHQVLKLLGTKQIYEESALAGGLEKVSSWIEQAGDWVEHKTGGKVPSEEVTTMVDGLMLLAGGKGVDLVKRLWEKRKAKPAPYVPPDVPLEQTVKQGPRATAQQDINEMLNIRSTRDRKAYEQKRRREVREAFTNDPDYADYLKFRAEERISNHDNWTKAARDREAREEAARASDDPKVPKPAEPVATKADRLAQESLGDWEVYHGGEELVKDIKEGHIFLARTPAYAKEYGEVTSLLHAKPGRILDIDEHIYKTGDPEGVLASIRTKAISDGYRYLEFSAPTAEDVPANRMPKALISLFPKEDIRFKAEEPRLSIEEILAKPGFQRTAEDLIALRRFNQSGYVKPELAARMAALGIGAAAGLWLDPEDPLQGSLLGGTAGFAAASLMGGPGKVTSRFKQAGAVKGPGGMWHPEAVERLSQPLGEKLAMRSREHLANIEADQPIKYSDQVLADVAKDKGVWAWSDKAIRNYLNKYAGTERDPLAGYIPRNELAAERETLLQQVDNFKTRTVPTRKVNPGDTPEKTEARYQRKLQEYQDAKEVNEDREQRAKHIWDILDSAKGDIVKDPLKDVEIPAGASTARWEDLWDAAVASTKAKTIHASPEGVLPNTAYNVWKAFEGVEKARPEEDIFNFGNFKASRDLNRPGSDITNYLSHVGDYLRQNVLKDTDPFAWMGRQPEKIQKEIQALTKDWEAKNPNGNGTQAMSDIIEARKDYKRDLDPLAQYDLVRAVKETAANDARVAKEMEKAAANSTKDLPVYKEYPDGMKWVELKLPEKLTAEQAKTVRHIKSESELRDLAKEEAGFVGGGGDIEAFYRDYKNQGGVYEALGADGKVIKNNYTQEPARGGSPEEAFLAGKLAEEGNQMGHCVGGSCAEVARGESRIFSLRDAKGESHVTVEVLPKGTEARGTRPRDVTHEGNNYIQKTDDISQIKGKQNRAPVAEYLPYVQDFVKSGPLDTTPNLAGTKVVDSSGKPAVVYHGGEVPAKFKPMTWFAVDKKMANMYIKERGGHGAITEAYLDIKNPADEAAIETAARKVGAIGPKEHVGNAYDYVTREMYLGKSKEQGYVGKVVRELRDRGYDGVHIVTDGDFGRGEAESWMAFFDKQIHRVGKGKGQWGEVGDLQNTGMVELSKTLQEKHKLGRYVTPKDIEANPELDNLYAGRNVRPTPGEPRNELRDNRFLDEPNRGPRGERGSIDIRTAAKLAGVVGGAAVGASMADNKVMGAILGGLGGLVLGGASPKGVASVFKKAWAPDTRIRINNLANSWEYKTEAAARGVFQLQTRLEQLLPKEADRVAVTHAIESGDLSTLSPRQRSAAGIAQQYFAKMAEVGQEAGVLKDAVANYVTHLWKQGTAAAGIVDEIFGRKGGFNMSPETKFALRRSVPTIAEGKAKGMIPKTEDISAIMGVYGNAINRAMANKELITALKNEKVPGTEEGLVLKDRDAPATYQKIDHPQLAGMRVHPDIVPSLKFIFDNHQPGVVMRVLDGVNMISKRMAVSFSLFHAKALADAFIGGASNPLKVAKHIGQSVAPKIFGTNEYLKQLREGGAGDLVDKAQQAGLKFSMGKDALGVEDVNGTFYTAMKDLQTGLDGVVKGLGLPVKGFVKANHMMDKFMWDRLHAGMKLSTFAEKYSTLLENNAKAHEKNPQTPLRPKEQLAEMAAAFTNDVFGGLNWRRIAESASTRWGREAALNLLSPAGRRVSQLLLFAPDWTLSTARAAYKAFNTGGTGVKGLIEPKTATDLHRQYLVRSAVYYLAVGDAINLSMSGHHLWENRDPTTIDMGDGRTMQWSKHTMESVHWLTKPRQQGLNKLGFIPREIANQALGSKYLSAYGKTPPIGNRFEHALKGFSPISVQQNFEAGEGAGIAGFLGTPIYGKTYAEREALKEQRRIKQRAERKIK